MPRPPSVPFLFVPHVKLSQCLVNIVYPKEMEAPIQELSCAKNTANKKEAERRVLQTDDRKSLKVSFIGFYKK